MAALPLLDVVVDAVLQYCSYQVSIVCKSVVDVQLAAPHTEETPAVPVRKGSNLESAQKQELDTSVVTGGVQAPWTSERGPHSEAQDGRSDVNGTMEPSANC